MSLGSVVLFEYKVAAGFFEQDFEQVRDRPVVISNQDASLFFHRRPPIEGFVHQSPCGGVPSPNRISASGLQRRSRPTRGSLPGASARENGALRVRDRVTDRVWPCKPDRAVSNSSLSKSKPSPALAGTDLVKVATGGGPKAVLPFPDCPHKWANGKRVLYLDRPTPTSQT